MISKIRFLNSNKSEMVGGYEKHKTYRYKVCEVFGL